MRVREAAPGDYEQIVGLHRSDGFSYDLPPLDHPLWVRRLVLEEGNEIAGASLGYLSAETYLMLKRASRMTMARRCVLLQYAAIEAAKDCGLTNLHAWVAPDVERGFGSHLLKLGWSKPLWPAYERRIGE